MDSVQTSLLSAYLLLVQDYQQALEFIEPNDANGGVFSHRLYALLLRTCTEFENAAKALAARYDIPLPARPNITHFHPACFRQDLSGPAVGLLFWQPSPRYIRPFDGWATPESPLAWYRDYNLVKHSREQSFPCASLANVTSALAGLFVLYYAHYSLEFFMPHYQFSWGNRFDEPGSVEIIIPGSLFSFRRPIEA